MALIVDYLKNGAAEEAMLALFADQLDIRVITNLFAAANFLDLEGLQHEACCRLAKALTTNCNSVEGCCELLGMECDFSKEEQALNRVDAELITAWTAAAEMPAAEAAARKYAWANHKPNEAPDDEQAPDDMPRADSIGAGREATHLSREAATHLLQQAGADTKDLAKLSASAEWNELAAAAAELPPGVGQEVRQKIELARHAKAMEMRGRLSRAERQEVLSAISTSTVLEARQQLKQALEAHPLPHWPKGDAKLGVLHVLDGRSIGELFSELPINQQLFVAHSRNSLRSLYTHYLKCSSTLTPKRLRTPAKKSSSELAGEARRLHIWLAGLGEIQCVVEADVTNIEEQMGMLLEFDKLAMKLSLHVESSTCGLEPLSRLANLHSLMFDWARDDRGWWVCDTLKQTPIELRRDEAFMLAAARGNGKSLKYASAELKNNEAVVLVAVQQDGHALEYASAELQGNHAVVLAAVQQNGHALGYASAELKHNEAVVLAVVQQDWRALRHVSAELQGNEAVVLAAVQQCGNALEYASAELQGNEAVVLAAVQQHWPALMYASAELQSNEAVVLVAVQQHWRALHYASAVLKGNEAVVLAAVQQDGHALESASAELQNNEAVVLVAVQQNGRALQYASAELQGKEAVVLAAVQQDGDALYDASPGLKNNEAVVLVAVQQNGRALQCASTELKNNEVIGLAAVQQDGYALQYASAEMQGNEAVVLAAVQQKGLALQYASAELKGNEAVVLAAVQQDWHALEYALAELKNNEAVMLAAVQQNGGALQCAPAEL